MDDDEGLNSGGGGGVTSSVPALGAKSTYPAPLSLPASARL